MVVGYFLKNIPPHIAKQMGWGFDLNYKDNKITKEGNEGFITRNIDVLKNGKIYNKFTIDNQNYYIPIFIYTTKSKNYIYIDEEFIYYENDSGLEEFFDIIKASPPPEINTENKNQQHRLIYKLNENGGIDKSKSSTVYSDRNFDNWVSVHKPSILRYISRFQKANETGKSDFNGFGSYNLGVIIHGEPGTGKTMFIKSLANALQKDVLIIDVKKIKTNSQFESIIKTYYKDYILAFDEFDSIDGVVSRDNKTEKDKSTILKNLEEQKIKLLSIDSENKSENIKKEIERIESVIQETNDKLDVFGMLTVIDGIEEYRGRVIVATTNYIDNIDSALIREGRFDFKFKLTKFKCEEIKELLCKMFSVDRHKYINSQNFSNDKYTPVQVMNIAMTNEFETTISILCDNSTGLKCN
jgi:nucleoside-triphosphatase THEP1